MKLEYEYYGRLDMNTGSEFNIHNSIRNWLWEMEITILYIKESYPDNFNKILSAIEEKYFTVTEYDFERYGFDMILENKEILVDFPRLKQKALQFVLHHLQSIENFILSENPVFIRWMDFLKPMYLLIYHRVCAIVEIMGREKGLEYYIEILHHVGKQLAMKNGVGSTSIAEVRENRVNSWKESNAFEFAVVDTNEHSFLAKFDKCISYESMKHVDDQELAYYSVCFPGTIYLQYYHDKLSLRRTQTLFSADFCDEYRWDRSIMKDPEQPSLELSKQLVKK
ncbi:MAG: hypothetical protein INQ03_14310 [Candidatus Heimdallarchaeota archaeon]|nr:hypothetical protein [Candidatus Heimdallarchaeota archaeon]